MSATPYGASVREFREDARSEAGLSLAILRIDPLLLLGTLGLVAAGIYVIGTATDTDIPGNPHYYVIRQGVYWAWVCCLCSSSPASTTRGCGSGGSASTG